MDGLGMEGGREPLRACTHSAPWPTPATGFLPVFPPTHSLVAARLAFAQASPGDRPAPGPPCRARLPAGGPRGAAPHTQVRGCVRLSVAAIGFFAGPLCGLCGAPPHTQIGPGACHAVVWGCARGAGRWSGGPRSHGLAGPVLCAASGPATAARSHPCDPLPPPAVPSAGPPVRVALGPQGDL